VIAQAPASRRLTARRRRVALVGAVLAVTASAVLVVALRTSGPPPPPLAAPVSPLYPDLGMAPLTSILVGQDQAGRVFLRFSATLVNVGIGRFLVAAHRGLPISDDWRVVQRVDDRTGGYSELETGARLRYAGDGHDHWHVVGAEAHQLETLDGKIVGALVKSGFCFFDNVAHALHLPGAPPLVAFTSRGCGTQYERDVEMGLSVGWGDEYQWYLLEQTIEITDVPDGRYRLRATADPAGQFTESNEANNDTWTLVDLSTLDGHRQVEVVEQGPAS
jgi:lysyl oxidase